MATTAKRVKDARKPKFSSRKHNRCKLCGRPRGYLRKFGICRLCFRGLALKGEIPGVVKASNALRLLAMAGIDVPKDALDAEKAAAATERDGA